MRCCCQDLF